MENNRYAQHRAEIDKISKEQSVDIGVACAILRDQMGWTFQDGKDTEITEFTAYVADMSPVDRAAYFAG